ncbi:DUF6174 domain-containing protein [Streptomyces sp. NPDC017936]|uniref:DUF6174 domain-containing protein n=1 Tax=Streptomyces sp. NPDC017936 TaxID=3365016 RepID=UPI00379784B3
MTALGSGPRRPPSAVVLIAGLVLVTAGCGGSASPGTGGPSRPAGATAWKEPASYVCTLESSEGERALIGTFRITVLDGKVAKAVGLDDSARRVVESSPDAVPTVGELLREWEQARDDGADTAEAEYAADGHPVRIRLDGDGNTLDDEALYVVSAYRPNEVP